ncbi:MAG TPA: glycoside hydrolase family 3 C-terminal domain-containing protein [Caulobacteraceae bacterium]|jgi:beta-glucosidase
MDQDLGHAPRLYADEGQPLEVRVEDLVARLTLEEKVSLMAGAASFTLQGVERLGVPAIRMTDGPTGVRSNEGEPATVFPVGVAMASTWNPELVREVAGAIGREALALDNQVVLAPTINIVRTPLWGRNFETFSEDPFLAGALGTAYVEGLQDEGVGASLKHFAANNQEHGRMTVSVEADERTLREIYLAAFETVVKAANPWTVMASYNRIGGLYATAHPWLLQELLKGEWSYDGVVVSDWGAVHDTVGPAAAGCDLEMPGPPAWFGDKLLAAVRAGRVPEGAIDESARRIVRLILRTGVLDGRPRPSGELRSARHREIAARAAEEAVVLLKNEGELLPLDLSHVRSVAVVGPNAAVRRIQGGGSSQVRAAREVSLLQAIQEVLGEQAQVRHAEGGDNEPVPPHARSGFFSIDEARSAPGFMVERFAERGLEGEPFETAPDRSIGRLISTHNHLDREMGLGAIRWTGWLWPEREGRHEIGLRAAGTVSLRLAGQTLIDMSTPGAIDTLDVSGSRVPRRVVGIHLEAGRGYEIVVEYVRPPTEDLPPWEYLGLGLRQPRGSVEEAAAVAAECDAAIAVIGAASVSEAEGYDREGLELPGDQNALVEAVLAANPRTVVVLTNGAPYALPWIDHVPAVVEAWLGGEEGPHATARILFGAASPSGRLPVSFPRKLEDTPAHGWYPGDESVTYGEGLFVGYRHFDRAAEPPLFAFGHGLTYTRFAYSDIAAPEVVPAGATVEVSFTLKNVGERAGMETAQVYVRPRGPSVERPVKELKGLAKVALEPRESRRITVTLDARAFSYWNPAGACWVAEPGSYDILVGCSAADTELQATVRLDD